MERKHRLSPRYKKKKLEEAGYSRAVLHPRGSPIVIQDFDGEEVFRAGVYGTEDSGTESRGVQILRSGGDTTGEITSDGISFGNPRIANVESDTIVTVGRATLRQFIDATNGSDDNDGLAPVTLADTFTGVGNLDARAMTDGYHTWSIVQGTAANATTVAGPAVSMVMGAGAVLTAKAQAGGMFEEQFIKFQMDKVPTVAAARVLVFFRMLDKGSWATNQQSYALRIAVPGGGGVPTQAIVTQVDGTTTSIAGPTANTDAQNFAANTDWSIRVQCYYNYITKATTIRSKCWKSSGAEPTSWEVSTTDTNDALLQRGGSVGFGADTNAIGNPNITYKFSGWTYQLLDPDLIVSDDSSGTASSLYYVPDSTSGPVQSLGAALRSLPSYVQGFTFITWHNGVDAPYEPNTHIDGYVGGGEVYLTSGGCTITGSLSFNGNSCFFHLGGLLVQESGGGQGLDANATIIANASRHVELFDCRIQSNSLVGSNIFFTQGAEGNVNRCQMNGNSTQCLLASEGAVVRTQNNQGAGTSFSYRANASVIFTTGSGPTGGTGGLNAGKVFATAASDALASTSAGTALGASTKVTKTWNAIASASYNTDRGEWAIGVVRQGSGLGDSDSTTNWIGFWLYSSAAAGTGVQATLTGKTINAAWITIRRADHGGNSGAQDIYLASFDKATFLGPPGAALHGPTRIGQLAWGQTKTFRIPQNIIDDLKTDATGGGANETRILGVSVASGRPYVVIDGTTGPDSFAASGRLKVTYT